MAQVKLEINEQEVSRSLKYVEKSLKRIQDISIKAHKEGFFSTRGISEYGVLVYNY